MNTSLELARLDKEQEQCIRSLEQELQCRIVPLEAKARYANLSPEQFVRLQGVERELGVALVAYEPEATFRVAQLPEKEVKHLQQLEKEIGSVFVAYQHVRNEPQVEGFRPAGHEPAELSDDQYERLQRSEADTGLLLMAYRKA